MKHTLKQFSINQINKEQHAHTNKPKKICLIKKLSL